MVITLDVLLKICAGFTAICVAGGWLIKVIKAAKKPADDVMTKLDNDNKRIKKLEDDSQYIMRAIAILLRVDLAMLGHMKTNNNSGEMDEAEREIQTFLIER